jgi:hypothetical protein
MRTTFVWCHAAVPLSRRDSGPAKTEQFSSKFFAFFRFDVPGLWVEGSALHAFELFSQRMTWQMGEAPRSDSLFTFACETLCKPGVFLKIPVFVRRWDFESSNGKIWGVLSTSWLWNVAVQPLS